MHIDDSDRPQPLRVAALPVVGSLRIQRIDLAETPQRRIGPRRRLVGEFLIERRRSDRREARPGIDGLLRMVLADNWK